MNEETIVGKVISEETTTPNEKTVEATISIEETTDVSETPEETVEETATELDPEIEADIEKLHSMNYVELTNALHSIEDTRKQRTSVFAAFEQLRSLYSSMDEVKEAFENAISQDPTLEKDRDEIEKFMENSEAYEAEYKENLAKLDQIAGLINAELEARYGNIKKTMKFWDDETIEYLEKARKESITTLGSTTLSGREIQQYRDAIRSIDDKLKAMSDRFDLNFWKERSQMMPHIKGIEKAARKDFMKNLANVVISLHGINAGITTDNFNYLYSFIIGLVPDTAEEKSLVAQIFLSSAAKVAKNHSTVLYTTRLINMIFAMMGGSYDYEEEDRNEAAMKARLSEILGAYDANISNSTRKMFARHRREMKASKEKK